LKIRLEVEQFERFMKLNGVVSSDYVSSPLTAHGWRLEVYPEINLDIVSIRLCREKIPMKEGERDIFTSVSTSMYLLKPDGERLKIADEEVRLYNNERNSRLSDDLSCEEVRQVLHDDGYLHVEGIVSFFLPQQTSNNKRPAASVPVPGHHCRPGEQLGGSVPERVLYAHGGHVHRRPQ